MSEYVNEAPVAQLARHLIGAADASACELYDNGRVPTHIAMHPDDVDVIYDGLFPNYPRGPLSITSLNLRVVEDERVRVGEPVAEFDPEGKFYP